MGVYHHRTNVVQHAWSRDLPDLRPSQGDYTLQPGYEYSDANGNEPSEHFTIIFTAFVFMQLFNEINCRKLNGETNVFAGILNNAWFGGILIVTFILQCILTAFGGRAFRCW